MPPRMRKCILDIQERIKSVNVKTCNLLTDFPMENQLPLELSLPFCVALLLRHPLDATPMLRRNLQLVVLFSHCHPKHINV